MTWLNLSIDSEAKLTEYLRACTRTGAFTHAGLALGNLNDINRPDILASDRGLWPVKFLSTFPSEKICVFDLASLTKALSTGFLLNILSRERAFSLESSIEALDQQEHLNFAGCRKLKQQTLSQLLGHRSQLPAWGCLWMNRLATVDNLWENRDNYVLGHIDRIILDRPDERAIYSDLGYIVLGLLLEKLTGFNQADLFESLLGCHLSHFLGYRPVTNQTFAPDLRLDNVMWASSGYCKIRNRQLFGEVHDENCASLGGVSGHAGLFGSLESVVECLGLMAQPGYIRYIQDNASLVGKYDNDGLCGMRQNTQGFVSAFAGGQAVGHLGFTGTSFYIDPKTLDFVVFLTNRTACSRLTPDFSHIRASVHTYAARHFSKLSR